MTPIRFSFAVTTAFSALLLCGCQSPTGYELAEKKVVSMQDLRRELVIVRSQINTTMASLNAIPARDGIDVREKYNRLAANITETEAQAQRVRSRALGLQKNAQQLYQAWDRELTGMQNENIARQNAARRTESVRSFNAIIAKMQQAKDAYVPFISDLTDVQSYLGTNLNPAGIQSASKLIREANAESSRLQASINAVINELDRVARETAPAGS